MSNDRRSSSGGRGSGYRSGGGHRDHERPQDAPNDSVSKYWNDYLKDGYLDDKGCLRREYVLRDQVESMVKAMCKNPNGIFWKDGLTTHQVRRYFNHCRRVETQLRTKQISWECALSLVQKLDIAAADGAAKSQRKIPPLFHDFIRRNVAAIVDSRDFISGFLPHFEAVMGFGQAHFKRDRS